MTFFCDFEGADSGAFHLWQLLNENPEPVICKVFGCGRTLSNQEKLFGDKCIHHSAGGGLIGDGRCKRCEVIFINARKYLYGSKEKKEDRLEETG